MSLHVRSSNPVDGGDDDEEEEVQQSSDKQHEREWKHECPADFVSFQQKCVEGTEPNRRGKNTELWLIKAPVHFNPSSLADLKVSLSGLETIQSTDTSQIYSVLASQTGPADLHLLTSGSNTQNASLRASGFAGVLSINESYGHSNGNQNLHPIPAAPAPIIPPGLRQRFRPFGSSTAPLLLQRNTLTSQPDLKGAKPESDYRQKKKKRAKEKHSSKEPVEEMHIKRERRSHVSCVSKEPGISGSQSTTEIKKKIKVKKEKEEEVAIDAGLVIKEEPMDSYEFTDGLVEKKKKKRRKQ